MHKARELLVKVKETDQIVENADKLLLACRFLGLLSATIELFPTGINPNSCLKQTKNVSDKCYIVFVAQHLDLESFILIPAMLPYLIIVLSPDSIS